MRHPSDLRRLPALSGWQAVAHSPRTLMVACVECRRGVVNESNQMRRAGWQELRFGRSWVYRCGRCAEQADD